MVDWNMPEMNGYDFIVAVRAQDKFSEVPIMMVTTESEMSQMTRAIEAGATGVSHEAIHQRDDR